MNFQRIWEPLNAHADVAYLTDRTRVRRWSDAELSKKSGYLYQVEIHNEDRWIPVSQPFPHAAAAWRRAERYVNAQMRVSTPS